MSLALAGGFSTIGPPGKPCEVQFYNAIAALLRKTYIYVQFHQPFIGQQPIITYHDGTFEKVYKQSLSCLVLLRTLTYF